MTTAIIGTGKIGSAVAGHLAAGGEPVRLASADPDSARTLADQIGANATAWATNPEALDGADAVVLAIWLDTTKTVIDELGDRLSGLLVIETSNPVAFDATGKISRTLPEGQSSGLLVESWLPPGTAFAKAFGTMTAEHLAGSSNKSPRPAVLFYAANGAIAASGVERFIRTAGFDPVSVGGIDQSGRIEVGGDLHDAGGLNGRVIDREEALGLVERQ